MVSPTNPPKLNLQNRGDARFEIDAQIETNQKFLEQLGGQAKTIEATKGIFESAVHQIKDLKDQNPYIEEYKSFDADEIEEIRDYLDQEYIQDAEWEAIKENKVPEGKRKREKAMRKREKAMKNAYLVGKNVSVLTKTNEGLTSEKKLDVAHQVKVLQDLSASKGIFNRIRFWWKHRNADQVTKEAFQFFRNRNLDKDGIKELQKNKKAVQDKIVDIIRETELATVKEIAWNEAEIIGGTDSNKMAEKVETILRRTSESGVKGKFFRFWYDQTVAKGSKTWICRGRTENALHELEKQHGDITVAENAFYKKIKGQFEKNPDTELSRRAGVIGFGEIYRIQHTFSKKAIAKQLRSYYVQELTKEDRHRIESAVQDKSGKVFGKSLFVPLNRELDDYMNEFITSEEETRYITMGNLYGMMGIAAADRKQPGLINGYLSEFELAGKGEKVKGKSLKENLPNLRFLRFGLIADQFEKDPEIREKTNKEIAKEALTAAVMLHLAENGIDPNDVPKYVPLEINYSHVSIVTPTKLSRFMATEDKKLLKEHMKALKAFEGETQFIRIGNVDVPVNFKVQTFNFGVNIGALGFKRKLLPKFGTRFQHQINKENWEKFSKESLEPFITQLDVDIQKHSNRLNAGLVPEEEQEAYKKEQDELVKMRQTITALRDDIITMMRSPTAYQESGMQFEAPAKILLLMNEMNKFKEFSLKASFGCYSDKDRSGVQDVVLKVFEEMRAEDGHYPTHAELSDPKSPKRERFIELYKTFIKTSGNLEIPRVNTGVPGIKWDPAFNFWPHISKKLKKEGRAGITDKTAAKILGLSKTAKT